MKLALAAAALAVLAVDAKAQQPPPQDRQMLLTIFLRHDQSKTLDEINAQLDRTGFRQVAEAVRAKKK